jgi:adenylate kinase
MAGFIKKEDSELVVARKVEKAKRVLKFDRFEMVNKGQVLTRYRTMVKALHPDTATSVVANAPAAAFNDLRQAKDYLVKQLEKNDD